VDAADLVGAGTDQYVDHVRDLGDVAELDGNAVAGAEADDARRSIRGFVVRGELRLQRQPRGLVILCIDAGALERRQHLAHRSVIGL
jgi:hypothetical protein